MGSKALASTAILLSLNLIFFTLVSSSNVPCSPTPRDNNHSYQPKPSTSPKKGSCPKDTLKLGVCANVLKALHLKIGQPPKTPCCSLIEDLVDLEAAVCLCTALKANVLGVVNLDIPISLSLLLNYCGKNVPSGFKCA